MARRLLTNQGVLTLDGLPLAKQYLSSGCLRCLSCTEPLKSVSSTFQKHYSTYSVITKTPGSAMQQQKSAINNCICINEARRNVQLLNVINSRDFQSSSIKTAITGDSSNDTDSDSDEHIRPALESVLPSVPTPTHVEIVPGKGPPPEPPVDCCMSGCANCVWIQYAEELKDYYSLEKGNVKAKEAIEQIDNPGLQMFLKLELGLL